ncbi:MAG: hypothetical protein K8H86_07360, partial [Ignavibacteriaceae bacterium]|nr:hypothetical protein [Ignavibacteriaceae bacterium]
MKAFSTFLFLSFLFFVSANLTAQRSQDFTPPASPDSILYNVVPLDYASTAGPGTFLSPLANSARTYLMLIHENQLTALVGKELKGISWRIPPSATAHWPAAEVVYTAYDIYLSGSVDPSARSLTFADNIVGTQTQVRSGALTIPIESYTFGKSPNDWGPQIDFSTSWLYSGGHLLIEIRTSGFTGTSRSNDAITTATPGYLTQFSSCWGSGYTATSGSQGNFAIARLSGDDPIPVELTSFTASQSNGNVELKWSTATETNNYGFEVERKTNDAEFAKIAFIQGAGTTTELKNYSFTDNELKSTTVTYRLKQIDYNGNFEYSNEINVELNNQFSFSLDQNYPNP